MVWLKLLFDHIFFDFENDVIILSEKKLLIFETVNGVKNDHSKSGVTMQTPQYQNPPNHFYA